ncbi:TPA: hypothetical protein ACY38O_000763 [Pasteurella multocida]
MKKLLFSLLLLPLTVGALETGQTCAKIDSDSARLICYDSIFRTGNDGKTTQGNSQSNFKSSPLPKKSSKSTNDSKKNSAHSSYGGSCPCSGAINCVGPRGGSYCYTSSGKKRYR